MGFVDFIKRKISIHSYDNDYVNPNSANSPYSTEIPNNVFIDEKFEPLSFNSPLSALYHKKTGLPFIDKNNRIWFFSESDHYQAALSECCGTLWETLASEIDIKVFAPDEIMPFLEKCYYLYGIDTASLNTEKNIINIKKYVDELYYRYDVNNLQSLLSNPVFRFNSIKYNQIFLTEFQFEDRQKLLDLYLSKYAKALFGSTLYCPFNIDGNNVLADNMAFESEGTRYICVFSDADAIGEISTDGEWRFERMSFAETLKKAFYQSSSLLINKNSCAVTLSCDEVKRIASDFYSDVNTDEETLSPEELYNKALLYKKENNMTEAMRLLRRSAELGYGIAQNQLGFIYFNGDAGLEKDINEAMKWFELSLASVDSSAMALATIYRDGIGVTINDKQALYYYKVASALGNTEAMLTVGMMTLKAIGTRYDKELGYSYIKKAAENGNEEAKAILDGVAADF